MSCTESFYLFGNLKLFIKVLYKGTDTQSDGLEDLGDDCNVKMWW